MDERELTEFGEELLRRVRKQLSNMEEITEESAYREIINTIFDDSRSEYCGFEEINELADRLYFKTRSRLGILEPLLAQDDITEIMVNGPGNIFVERKGKIEKYSRCFDSVEELEDVMQQIAAMVHREINELNPIVDARLEDGSRVSGVYKNVAINGPILTIRKFPKQRFTMDDIRRKGTITEEAQEFLAELVKCGYNLFISGGTSSGKTTFLNALSDYIPESERVVVIEDSMELQIDLDNIVRLEVRNANSRGKGLVDMSRLIKASLRMRPDRIIVGEVRGGEVIDMLSAMNTGHDGSLGTGHGNSVQGMLKRIESMYLAALPMSVEAIRSQIAEAIDVMIHLERDAEGNRKVMEITELCGYHKGEFVLNTLFRVNSDGQLIREQGKRLVNSRKLELRGEKHGPENGLYEDFLF